MSVHIGEALRTAARRLDSEERDGPLEAALLLGHLLGRDRSWLIAWSDQRLTDEQQAAFEALLQRRLAGEPVAHILGRREFWSLPLRVNAHTLIPRPDTELLVERALALLAGRPATRVADLGTGSGAIAAALASERPGWRILATDRSAEALAVARNNFEALGLAVDTAAGHWCAALPEGESFDLLVSNPPYIPEFDSHLRQGDLPHEPIGALASGPDGLADLREICACAPPRLAPGGWLLVEHGYDQGPAVRELMQAAGLRAMATHRDLGDRERCTEGRRAGPERGK